MRKWSGIGALLTLVILTIGTQIPVVSVEPAHPIVAASGTLEKYERYGPRLNDLNFSVCGDVLTESEALAAGDIDIMDWATPGGYVTAWDADPNITIEEVAGFGIFFHALNNQMWPIGHGEMTPVGWTGDEPAVTTGHYWINYSCQRCLDARQFRRALAHLSDRAAMVANMKGFIELQFTFIPPILDEWKNPDVPKYPYSVDLAEAAFLDGGFADWDGDDVMEYSPGHDGVVVEELPTIIGWIRSDDPDSTFAGLQLRDDLLKLGVPLDMPVVDRSTWFYHTYVVRDYHISTDALSAHSLDPSAYYEIFYSKSESHIGYHSEEFDYWFEKLLYATTMEEARAACDMCQWIIARDVASIPLYTFAGYWAHRTNYGTHAEEEVYQGLKWEGFVNELRASFPSFWTYLNAHPQGFAKGGTLRQGLLVNIEKFNPVHAEWFYDWLILQTIYEPLIKNHPYNVTEKIPWLCSNWTVGTWELEGETCTRLRFKLLPSILWHDHEPLTVEDVSFSFTYMRDEVSVANYWAVQNFHDYITAANGSGWWGDPLPPDTIDILYDARSRFALDWAAGVPIIPKHIWEGQDSWTWNPEDHGAVIGSGPFMAVGGDGPHEGEVGWPDWTSEYVYLVANPLYHRRYVWPDATNAAHGVMARDGVVTRADYDEVRWPGHKLTYDPRLHPLLPAWDTSWMNTTTGDHYLDVDKNGAIDVEDLLEISVRYGQEWPPPWYVDC